MTKEYYDGGDPPQTAAPYFYPKCILCGYWDEEDRIYEEDEEDRDKS